MTALVSYSTGTISIAAGGTTATGVGTIWSGTSVRPGDILQIGNFQTVISDVTDTTHLVVPPWGGGAQAGVAYKIWQVSPQRFAGAQAMQAVNDLVAALDTSGFFVFVDTTATVPDPSLGDDGQYAFQPTTGKTWAKVAGVWTYLGVYKAFNLTGAYNNLTTYSYGDVQTTSGSSYIYINSTPSAGNAAPNATYWQLSAAKGDPGSAGGAGATGAGYGGTSTTSLTIGTGSKAFTTQAGLAYTNGARVRATATAGATGWLEGVATYSGTTLTITSDKTSGSGTGTAWNLNLAGEPGAGDVSSANNGSEFNAATFASNLSLIRYVAQALTAAQKSQARANIGVQKKNYFLNGAMMISQEKGTTAGSVTGYYPVDQFAVNFQTTTGVYSAAQVSSTSPAGSPNRLRVTVTTADAAVGTGDIVWIDQKVEGVAATDLLFGAASAKSIVIQFGVKAPAGIYCVTVLNSAQTRSYVAEYTIAGGEANTDVVKSVVIPGDTTGTWLKDTGIGLWVRWGLMCGSSFQQAAGSWAATNMFGSSNQFNLMGTNGNVFELFDVGLYEGTVAPEFQVPDYASELIKCQRYFERVAPSSGAFICLGGFESTSRLNAFVTWKVDKRATGTLTMDAVSNFTVRQNAGAVSATASSFSPGNPQASVLGVFCDCNVATTPFTAGQFGVLSAAGGAGYNVNCRM
jgi:hypothetical protein